MTGSGAAEERGVERQGESSTDARQLCDHSRLGARGQSRPGASISTERWEWGLVLGTCSRQGNAERHGGGGPPQTQSRPQDCSHLCMSKCKTQPQGDSRRIQDTAGECHRPRFTLPSPARPCSRLGLSRGTGPGSLLQPQVHALQGKARPRLSTSIWVSEAECWGSSRRCPTCLLGSAPRVSNWRPPGFYIQLLSPKGSHLHQGTSMGCMHCGHSQGLPATGLRLSAPEVHSSIAGLGLSSSADARAKPLGWIPEPRASLAHVPGEPSPSPRLLAPLKPTGSGQRSLPLRGLGQRYLGQRGVRRSWRMRSCPWPS